MSFLFTGIPAYLRQLFHCGVFGLFKNGFNFRGIFQRHCNANEVFKRYQSFLFKTYYVTHRDTRFISHLFTSKIFLNASCTKIIRHFHCNVIYRLK